MIPRVPLATRRLCAGLQIGAVAVLTMLAPVLVPAAQRRIAHPRRSPRVGDEHGSTPQGRDGLARPR